MVEQKSVVVVEMPLFPAVAQNLRNHKDGTVAAVFDW